MNCAYCNPDTAGNHHEKCPNSLQRLLTEPHAALAREVASVPPITAEQLHADIARLHSEVAKLRAEVSAIDDHIAEWFHCNAGARK